MALGTLNYKCFQSFINHMILELVPTIRLKYLDIIQILFYKVCCFVTTGIVTNYFSTKEVNI